MRSTHSTDIDLEMHGIIFKFSYEFNEMFPVTLMEGCQSLDTKCIRSSMMPYLLIVCRLCRTYIGHHKGFLPSNDIFVYFEMYIG